MTRRTGNPRGRPRSPAIGRALELVAAGASLADAARESGCHEATVRRARDRQDAPSPSPTPTLGPVATRLATAAPAPIVAHARPAGGTDADDLEIIDAEIEAVRAQLREARATKNTHGTASMQKNLLDLIRRRRDLRPPPPPDPGEEERRWKADAAAARAKIAARLTVPDRCPHCGVAL